MIYTYSFTNEFFEDMRNNINSNQILDVIDFLKINIQSKENLHYCGSEDIYENYGKNGDNAQPLDHFINSFFQTSARSNFLNKEKNTDIIFYGNNEKVNQNVFKINCNKILYDLKSLKKQIEEKIEDDWTNENGKKDLNQKLNQLLKFSKSIIFVDRHIPACIVSNVPVQLKQWRLSLDFYNSLISKYSKINSFFINGINDRIIRDYIKVIEKNKPNEIIDLIYKIKKLKEAQSNAKKNNEPFNDTIELESCLKKIELEGKEILKKDLKKFFLPLSDIKTYVMIKDKDAWRELHDRYIFFFFEEFNIEKHTLEEFVRDKNLNIFEVSEGLNILDVKSKTTSNRKIIRQKDKIAAQISKKWDKKVSKLPHFYKFRANQEKKAS